MTIEDFGLHSDDHFESHLLGNGLLQQHFHVWHFLENLLPPPDFRSLLNPKRGLWFEFECTYLRIWSFRPTTSIFCTKELYNHVLFPFPPLYSILLTGDNDDDANQKMPTTVILMTLSEKSPALPNIHGHVFSRLWSRSSRRRLQRRPRSHSPSLSPLPPPPSPPLSSSFCCCWGAFLRSGSFHYYNHLFPRIGGCLAINLSLPVPKIKNRILGSQCCGMPSCPLLCICVWCALPQFWAPVTNASLSGQNLANNGHSRYAEASQSRRRPGPQAIFFWTVLARRRATLREFSAVF